MNFLEEFKKILEAFCSRDNSDLPSVKFENPYLNIDNLPKTKKFGCVGRGDLTSLFFSKVVKY